MTQENKRVYEIAKELGLSNKEVLEKLKVLGIKVDEEANNVRGVETKITMDDSSIPAFIIPTNEELMIAKDTYSLVLQG